ncbi:MAG: PKD domain-containing protein, partial [Candidatus Thermoplasmatota archaeon]|nr:PKD domain-containing protein [Candidatus Thermoplasmatota archaeon]
MERKWISISLSLILITVMFVAIIDVPEADASDGSFGGGSGTMSDPYLIEDVWDLRNITSGLALNYALKNDINASITRTWNSGAGFMPIGTSTSNDFRGSLDGRGYNITNLYINRSSSSYVGLFGMIDHGTVKNLNLKNASIRGYWSVGSIAGYNNGGSISHCSVNGTVSGWRYIGGYCGQFYNLATISSSYFSGNVTGTDFTGVIVGWLNRGSVAGSFYDVESVNINGKHQFMFGALYKNQFKDWLDNDRTLNISHYNSTLIPSGTTYTISTLQGMKDLLGFAHLSDNSYKLGSDIDLGSAPGLNIPHLSCSKFDGRGYSISNITVDQPFASYVGFIGYKYGGIIVNLTVRNVNITGNIYVGGLIGRSVSGDMVNINCIGSVEGDQSIGGLIGYLNTDKVTNCTVRCDVTGRLSVGGLIGYLNYIRPISQCGVWGNVSGEENVGGIIGYVRDGGIISYVSYTGNVSGTESIGGLIGELCDGSLSYASAVGTVKGSKYVGGAVGYSGRPSDMATPIGEYTLTKISYKGNVTGSTYTAGLIGYSYVGKIYESCSKGYVKGGDSTGGMLGHCDPSHRTYFYRSFSECEVKGNSYVGGFVGWANGGSGEGAYFSDCYATGATIGSSYVGGFGGRFRGGWLYYSYSSGKVTGSSNTGGLVGYAEDTSNMYNYWDTTTSGRINSALGSGKTTTQMMKKSTYSPFDFTTKWCIVEDETYALLRWQDMGPPSADAGPDSSVEIGILIFFNGSSSKDDIGIANYTWSFDDDGSVKVYGKSPKHAFKSLGKHNITLNVTDPVGRFDTDEFVVSVNDTIGPVADAGGNQTFNEDTNIKFNGSKSTDNGKIKNYTWSFKDSGPVLLYGRTPSYIFSQPGMYLVTLNVTDLAGHWDIARIYVKVLDITSPISDAGPNGSIDEGQTFTFNGSGSSDNVGITNYTWIFKDVDLISLYGLTPSYRFEYPGEFIIVLQVMDAQGNNHSDQMTITVNDITDPIADAGPDQTVNEDVPVTFNGSSSTDNVGIVNWTWTFNDGSPRTLYGQEVTHTFTHPGIYTITLNTTDASGNWGTDDLNLTVLDVTKPIANAGPDMIVDEDTVVTFDGSSSTDNVGIVNWTWTFHDSFQRTLYGKIAIHVFTQPGIYVVALSVRDEAGYSHSDDLTLTVNDITDPFPDAGKDQIIDEDTFISFNGSSSSDNVGIVNWTWTFFDGVDVTLFGPEPRYVFSEPGNYEVTLIVTDEAGNSRNDILFVTVRDVTRPMADAGDDIVIYEDLEFVFNGSSSSDNGGIVSWVWSFLDDREVTLGGSNPTYTFREPGIYTVTLNLTDEAGNWALDIITVTVLDVTRPDADAGHDDEVDEDSLVTF